MFTLTTTATEYDIYSMARVVLASCTLAMVELPMGIMCNEDLNYIAARRENDKDIQYNGFFWGKCKKKSVSTVGCLRKSFKSQPCATQS